MSSTHQGSTRCCNGPWMRIDWLQITGVGALPAGTEVCQPLSINSTLSGRAANPEPEWLLRNSTLALRVLDSLSKTSWLKHTHFTSRGGGEESCLTFLEVAAEYRLPFVCSRPTPDRSEETNHIKTQHYQAAIEERCQPPLKDYCFDMCPRHVVPSSGKRARRGIQSGLIAWR